MSQHCILESLSNQEVQCIYGVEEEYFLSDDLKKHLILCQASSTQALSAEALSTFFSQLGSPFLLKFAVNFQLNHLHVNVRHFCEKYLINSK